MESPSVFVEAVIEVLVEVLLSVVVPWFWIGVKVVAIDFWNLELLSTNTQRIQSLVNAVRLVFNTYSLLSRLLGAYCAYPSACEPALSSFDPDPPSSAYVPDTVLTFSPGVAVPFSF